MTAGEMTAGISESYLSSSSQRMGGKWSACLFSQGRDGGVALQQHHNIISSANPEVMSLHQHDALKIYQKLCSKTIEFQANPRESCQHDITSEFALEVMSQYCCTVDFPMIFPPSYQTRLGAASGRSSTLIFSSPTSSAVGPEIRETEEPANGKRKKASLNRLPTQSEVGRGLPCSWVQ